MISVTCSIGLLYRCRGCSKIKTFFQIDNQPQAVSLSHMIVVKMIDFTIGPSTWNENNKGRSILYTYKHNVVQVKLCIQFAAHNLAIIRSTLSLNSKLDI